MLVIAKLLVIYGLLAGALWLLSVFLYNYLYTEAPSGLSWRVPTASGIIVICCLGFPLLVGHWTGKSLPVTWGQFLMDTTPEEGLEFDSVRVLERNRWTEYRRSGQGLGAHNFVSADRRRFPRDVAEFVAITKDNREIKFRALRDEDGYYVKNDGGIVYLSEDGYRLSQLEFGRIDLGQRGGRYVSFFAFVLGMASWIAGFVVLQFNLGHAIGFGIGLYCVWLFVMRFFF